jgi:uncharacterized protein (TIGR03067 family)
MMKRAIVFVATVLLAYAGTAGGGDSKKDQDQMQGIWLVESFLDSDPKGGIPPDIVKDFRALVQGDKLTVLLKDKDKIKDKDVMSLKFTLDPSKSLKAVDLTYLDGPEKGKMVLAIYKFDGDKLVMAINDPGLPRPTAFTTKEGTKVFVITLKRKK